MLNVLTSAIQWRREVCLPKRQNVRVWVYQKNRIKCFDQICKYQCMWAQCYDLLENLFSFPFRMNSVIISAVLSSSSEIFGFSILHSRWFIHICMIASFNYTLKNIDEWYFRVPINRTRLSSTLFSAIFQRNVRLSIYLLSQISR